MRYCTGRAGGCLFVVVFSTTSWKKILVNCAARSSSTCHHDWLVSRRAVESVRGEKNHDDQIATVDQEGFLAELAPLQLLCSTATAGTECYLSARTIGSSRTTCPCWQRSWRMQTVGQGGQRKKVDRAEPS
ncbi:hypothetical protein M441DRAFT_57124 [Trichoderma asperellum CBS 433.97]|uniref:Uncharacterized protein n=1 Tax=Trichoderma asperellum (strain ATCC 204424 / CBS 433.97 / NBRC 101777) TaxID=1042311 RepID=A0A2T3ZC45_TRIA4|nr:hypothetical protein M441DRAFT_57124 [Trichoderma asperellum CBS 433.97]PTB42350.1 hypothetical protein M441DRAFT_57124 [Trichoderma asperellum CBS 433.97]